MDWESFKEIVRAILPRSLTKLEFEDEQIIYTINEKNYVYTIQEFNEIISNFSHYTNCATYIYNQNEIEVLLDPLESRYSRPWLRFHDKGVFISGGNISYRIQTPSNELTLALISAIPKDEIRDYRRMVSAQIWGHRYAEKENPNINLFDILLGLTRASWSIKIVSSETIPLDDLKKYANAFLFSLSYNTGTAFKLTFDISDLSLNRSRVMHQPRLNQDQIEAPKLFYYSELTEQYNLALSSDDAFIQFISYYHIMEYFFDHVYNEALLVNVKEILQHPSFSTKSNKEIMKIIDIVQKKTKVSKEEFLGSELEALELTIKAYVKLEELHFSLDEFAPSSISYYKSHEVSFSNGDAIDLSDVSNEKLPKKIAARIYKTRNSLVHSKSNDSRVKERGIYHPFADEKELAKEIPLMRIIAESIIINSAKPI